jgi:hypothetical protein
MQRKSIHEPKISREDEQQPSRAAALQSKPQSRPQPDPLPATQIVDRPSVGRSTLPEEFASDCLDQLPAKQMIIKLSTRKRKLDEDNSNTRVTRSQGRKNKETGSTQSTIIAPVETQIVNEPVTKRRKQNNAPAPAQARSRVKKGGTESTQSASNVADLVKTSSRTTAATTKRVKASGHQAPFTAMTPLGSPKKTARISNAGTILRQPDGRFSAHHRTDVPGSRTTKPKNPTKARKPTQRKVPCEAVDTGVVATSGTIETSSPRAGAVTVSGLRKGPCPHARYAELDGVSRNTN